MLALNLFLGANGAVMCKAALNMELIERVSKSVSRC